MNFKSEVLPLRLISLEIIQENMKPSKLMDIVPRVYLPYLLSTRMKNITVLLSTVLLAAFFSYSGYAQQTVKPDALRTISYQGLLLDESKQPVIGSHHITVRLYDAPQEGSLLHVETFTSDFANGIFSVIIGSQQPIEAAIRFDKQYWVGVTVDNSAELSPRTTLVSVPYAIHADMASSLAKGASGAVISMNGRSGDLTIKGGPGTFVQAEGNTITISTIQSGSLGNQQTQQSFVNSLAGTTNQIIASASTGNVTLSLPQNIHTAATPTFAGMTLTNFNISGVLHNNSSGTLSSSLIGNGDVASSAAIAYSKLNLSGSIANADISSGANIAYSKLSLAGSISNADISNGANISASKINLTNAIASGAIVNGTIVNADVNANANIAYSKLNLIGSISNADVANGANISANKINLINAISTGDIVNGTIVNTDVNANAGIAYSKLNLAGSISNADIANGANIAANKINLINAISTGDIVNGTIVNSDVNGNAAIAYSKLNLGGSIANSDIAAGAAITDTKLATISTAGKVSNSATTATSANNANTIILRDNSGNFSANTITATLNGNAANVSGTIALGHGGTGFTTFAKGDILYASAANTLSKLSVGALGQVITISGGVPVWAALSGVGVTSATGTTNQVLINGDILAHTGGLTFSLPQNIHSGASPTFAGLSLTGKATSASTVAADPATTLATKDYIDNLSIQSWNVGGNTGMNASNYFGTNDATDIVLKTNSNEAMRLTNGGSLLLSGTSGTTPTGGSGTRMMWIPSLGAIRAGKASGSEWNTGNVGSQSVAMGYGTLASGDQSVAMGYFTSAYGMGSTAIGSGAASYADGATALGSAAQAVGYNSVAMGDNTTAWGDGSTALGSNTNSYGIYSTAMGYNTKTTTNYGTSMGKNLTVGLSSFGFNGSTTSTTVDVSSMDNVAYFGDADLLIGNDDNAARSIRFYGSNNSATLSGAHFSAFKAQTQTADINYLLPAAQGAANSILLNDGSGSLSWATLSNLTIPTGSGTANNLAIWSSSSALGAGSNLYYSSNRLGIGVSSPSEALDVSGNANISGIITSGGIAMSGGSAVLSYSTVSAGATIAIPNNAVVKITDDAATNSNAVTMPGGTNGQIIYIYNNDAQTTSGDITLANGAMGVYIYVDGWRKAN